MPTNNDFSHLLETVVEMVEDGLDATRLEFEDICQIKTVDSPTLQLSDLYGVGHYSTTVASPNADAMSSSSKVLSSVSREKKLIFFRKDVRDRPDLPQHLAKQVIQAATSTVRNLFWAGFAGLPTLAHPDEAYAGAGKYFVDSFSETVTQSNKLTVSLSADSLALARTRLRAYKNKKGLPLSLDVSSSNLALVVPSTMLTEAMDLVAVREPTYDGTGLTTGTFHGMQVIDSPYLSDSDDFGVIHKPTTPLIMWMRKAPDLRIEPIPGTNTVSLISEMECVFGVDPFEAGIVMSVV